MNDFIACFYYKYNIICTLVPICSQVDQFLDSLINFDKENIADSNLTAVRPYLASSEFDPDFIRNKSFAAAGLCAWVVNIVRFYEVFCDVEPKRKALATANAELKAAQDRLGKIKAKIKVYVVDLFFLGGGGGN